MTSASTPPSSGGSTSSDAVAGLEGRVESWLYSVVYICNCLFNIYLSPRHDVRGSRVMTCGSAVASRVTHNMTCMHMHNRLAASTVVHVMRVPQCTDGAFHHYSLCDFRLFLLRTHLTHSTRGYLGFSVPRGFGRGFP